MLSFTDALKVVFARGLSTNGRAARSEFWWSYLALIGLAFVSLILVRVPLIGPIAGLACSVVILLAFITLAIRRLHDRDMSGWWVLLVCIPSIGVLILLVLCALPGSYGPNRFGDNPYSGLYANLLKRNFNFKSFNTSGEGFGNTNFPNGNGFGQNQHQQNTQWGPQGQNQQWGQQQNTQWGSQSQQWSNAQQGQQDQQGHQNQGQQRGPQSQQWQQGSGVFGGGNSSSDDDFRSKLKAQNHRNLNDNDNHFQP